MTTHREVAAVLELASARLRTAAAEVDRGEVTAAKQEIVQAVDQVRAVVPKLKELDAA